MIITRRAIIFVFLFLVTASLFAQQKGSNELTDHPLYARRENAQIVSKKVSITDKYYLMKRYREIQPNGEVVVNNFKLMSVTGKLTRINYFVPAWRLDTEHDSLLERFCNDLIFLHEFVSPIKRNLDLFVSNVNGYYPALGGPKDKIPEDNYYFVLSRFKNGKKVYVVITGGYELLHEGNYYTVDVIETSEKQFITIYEIAEYIHKEGTVNIFSIEFEFGSSRIKPESRVDVKILAEFLKSEPRLRITIGGHTDNVGNENYNQRLSENRAKSLKRMLVEVHGIAPSRVIAIGYGESRPIATNNTEEGRALNRRVEIIKVK